DRPGRAAQQARQVESARGYDQDARRFAARRAHDGRSRIRELRSGCMVRPACASRDTARDRRPPEQGDGGRAQGTRHERASCGNRRDDGRRCARAVRPVHRRRDCQVGSDRQARTAQSRVKASMNDTVTSFITEPARRVPVLFETDVIVVGGGTTGPIAAISAARQGKRVVLIERFGSLGGNLTLGLNTKPSGALVGGLPLEIWNLARSVGGAGDDYMAGVKTGGGKVASPCGPAILERLLTRLCKDAGVQILFETVVSTPVLEGRTVTGVIIEGKSGRQFIAAKVVIDCSADADVATRAGAPFVMGTGGREKVMQPVSMY